MSSEAHAPEFSEGTQGEESTPAVEPSGEKPTRKRAVKEAFNGLTTREWTILSRNVWNDVSSPRDKHHLEHGAVFPVRLADRLIRLYSAPGDLVFDPFVGVGSTLIAALRAGRPSVGIELNARFVEIAEDWISQERGLLTTEELHPVLVKGDSRQLKGVLKPNVVQLTVTSPPYANFIRRSVADRQKTHKTSRFVHHNNSRAKVYSDDPRDMGNLDYEEFLQECRGILSDLRDCTREGGYAVWIVKDYRLPPKRPYVPLHSDLAAVAQEAGWLWHDLIMWDQNEQRSLVLLGFPTRFYTNQNCSFLVVLRKDG
jgi:DNA modification methylase